MKRIIVQDQIFDLFPGFYRGIVVVEDLVNHPSYKRIRKLLKKEIDRRHEAPVANDPRLTAWDDAHRRFGSDPDQYFPSIRSLLNRIAANPALPFINAAVALFNYISLKYCIPCGGDDVRAVEGDLVLGLSDGTEKFTALGTDETTSPEPGEVIYFDSTAKNVMCRRWNWRNGDHTKIQPDTKFMVINLDCLPPTQRETTDAARDELAELLTTHCNARVKTAALHSGCRTLPLPLA